MPRWELWLHTHLGDTETAPSAYTRALHWVFGEGGAGGTFVSRPFSVVLLLHRLFPPQAMGSLSHFRETPLPSSLAFISVYLPGESVSTAIPVCLCSQDVPTPWSFPFR